MNKCKHCGKDITEGVKFCSHCGKSVEEAQTKGQETLLAQVKEAVVDSVKGLKESVEKTASELSTLKEKVDEIEKLPFKAKDTNVIVPKTYKGYKLHEQGTMGLREKFAKGAGKFLFLSQESHFEKFSEFIIDFVKATFFKDPESHAKLMNTQLKTGLEEATGSLGGYLVPIEYQRDVITLARETSFALQKCTVLPMSTNVMKVPAEASLVTTYWKAEKTAGTASDPGFGQVTLTANKLFGLTNPIGAELLADADYDIVGALTEMFSYAMGLELDNQVLNGTGSPCSGILTAAAGYSVVMATGSTNFSSVTADNFRAMIKKLSSADSVNGEFVYSKDIQYLIDVLKDTTNNYIYRAPGDASAPGKLWSRGVIESSKAPLDASSGASTAFAAFGDFKGFFIGRRKGEMSLDIDPYSSFSSDEVRFRMISRWALSIARATKFSRLVTAGS